MKSTIEFMKTFQAWRRGADIPQPSPAAVGVGLDALILAAERYEKLRRLNLPQFQELYIRNIKTSEAFDDLVDALPNAVASKQSNSERFNDWWESRERNEFVGVTRFDAKRIWLSALDDIGALK